jgi:hypothetical protein
MTKFKQQNIEAIRNSAGKACALLKILANEDRLTTHLIATTHYFKK